MYKDRSHIRPLHTHTTPIPPHIHTHTHHHPTPEPRARFPLHLYFTHHYFLSHISPAVVITIIMQTDDAAVLTGVKNTKTTRWHLRPPYVNRYYPILKLLLSRYLLLWSNSTVLKGSVKQKVLYVFLFREQTARNGGMPYHWKAYCTMRNTHQLSSMVDVLKPSLAVILWMQQLAWRTQVQKLIKLGKRRSTYNGFQTMRFRALMYCGKNFLRRRLRNKQRLCEYHMRSSLPEKLAKRLRIVLKQPNQNKLGVSGKWIHKWQKISMC